MSDAAIVIADSHGVIVFWSTSAERLLGHSSSVALGKTLDLIVPEAHRTAHWAGFKRAIASGSARVEGHVGDFEALRPDGSKHALPGRLTLIRDANNAVFAAMVVFG